MDTIRLDQVDLLCSARLELAGVQTNFRTNSRTLWEILQNCQSSGWAEDADLRIRVLATEQVCERSSSPHFRGLHHVVVATFSPWDRIVFDLRRKQVDAVVSHSLAEDRRFWTEVLIPILIGVMGPSVGVAPVHCACLELEGEGILIAGLSGAGKSTLTAALARAGLTLISDDWTYVAQQRGELVAHGLGVPLKLLPDAIRFFPELAGLTPGISLNGELAYEFNAAKVLNARTSSKTIPRQMIFLERSTTAGFNAVPPEVALQYFRCSAERLPAELPELVECRDSLLRQLSSLPCHRLAYAGPPHDGAMSLVERVASAGALKC